ncbi:hypothetical protein ACFV23_22560 [Streptomyces sp. NPDC059627]
MSDLYMSPVNVIVLLVREVLEGFTLMRLYITLTVPASGGTS